MKLYTEEQMRKCYEGVLQNVGTSIRQSDLPNVDAYINSLTPIELPSDEEIDNESETSYRQYPSNPKEKIDWKYGEDVNAHRKRKAFIKGAKWMRDKIQGGNQ